MNEKIVAIILLSSIAYLFPSTPMQRSKNTDSTSKTKIPITTRGSLPASRGGIYKTGSHHVPLWIGIDQNNKELPSHDNVGVITEELGYVLWPQNIAILVSARILYNFVYRKQHLDDPAHPENDELKDFFFLDQEWDLYIPNGMQFFAGDNQLCLLIPKNQAVFFGTAFNLKNMRKIDEFSTIENGEGYDKLIKLLEPTKKANNTSVKNIAGDLDRIFVTIPPQQTDFSQFPVWDIDFTGHGDPKPNATIANLKPAEMQEFLTFFNIKLNVGVLIISSCYAGGKNIGIFNFKKDINNDKVFAPLNYVIIVNSVGDTPTTTQNYGKPTAIGLSFFEAIFEIAQNLGKDKDNSLEMLSRILGDIEQDPSFIHQQANIPQIILPGGIAIQSLTPSDAVMVLGIVKARAAELEKRPIMVYPKTDVESDSVLNLLLYPDSLTVPLLMRASRFGKDFNLDEITIEQWEHLPTFSEIVKKNAEMFEASSTSIFDQPLRINELLQTNYLYPNIISMKHGKAVHRLQKIVFEGDALMGIGGVIMGIRDAFCDLGERITIKNFYVESVEGLNDLSLILKAIRVLNGVTEKYPLENLLPKDGQVISLKNVFISTVATPRLKLIFKFELNNTIWELNFNANQDNQKLWDFKQDQNIAAYRTSFQKSTLVGVSQK